MKVGKKEFYANVSKYLKPGIIILTNRDKDELKIEVTNLVDVANLKDNKVANLEPKVANVQQRIDKVLTTVPGMKTVEDKRSDNIASGNRYAKKFTPNWQRDTSKYGCGCKKEEGQALCTKHGRG